MSDSLFVLGTLVPSLSIVGAWYLPRNRPVWLRAPLVALALFGSPILGFDLVMRSTEHGTAGAGVAAFPMLLLWFGTMLVMLAVEGARAWLQHRANRQRHG